MKTSELEIRLNAIEYKLDQLIQNLYSVSTLYAIEETLRFEDSMQALSIKYRRQVKEE